MLWQELVINRNYILLRDPDGTILELVVIALVEVSYSSQDLVAYVLGEVQSLGPFAMRDIFLPSTSNLD
jgi:hypothetical protein